MTLSPSQIRVFFPKCPAAIAEALPPAMAAAEINTLQRAAAFLAQVGHESGGLVRLVENLNYSAEGLAATWPNRYANPDKTPNRLALTLARRPEAIANNCYADRMGNGPESSGDGWRYRGRGLIQVTGRANYAETGRALALPLLDEPGRLELPEPAVRSACWFWQSKGCNALADAGDFLGVTRRINGGTHGHAERLALRNRIVKALQS